MSSSEQQQAAAAGDGRARATTDATLNGPTPVASQNQLKRKPSPSYDGLTEAGTEHGDNPRHLHRKISHVEKQLPGILATGTSTLDAKARRLAIKNEIVAAAGEFCGTFLFLFLAYGIATVAGQEQNAQPNPQGTKTASQYLYSSLGFGFSLAVNVFVFFRVSGGLLNPAIALALFLTKSITWYRFIILFAVEMAGGLTAGAIVNVLLPGGLDARTTLGEGTTVAQGFFIEMLMTAQLTMAVFMLAGEKHRATFLAPVGIGLALFIAELFATPFTGGSLNPARTLPPDVMARKFAGSCWIYYSAPFAGTLLATAVYKIFKWFIYETANAKQDASDLHLISRDLDGRIVGFIDELGPEEMPEWLLKKKEVDPAVLEAGVPDAVERSDSEDTAYNTNNNAGNGQRSYTVQRDRPIQW